MMVNPQTLYPQVLMNRTVYNTFVNEVYQSENEGEIILYVFKKDNLICRVLLDVESLLIIKNDVYTYQKSNFSVYKHNYGVGNKSKGVSLRKEVYASTMDDEEMKNFTQNIYLKAHKEDEDFFDFRRKNLTVKRGESYAYDKEFAVQQEKKYLRPNKVASLKKRMSADYSRKLQGVNTINKRMEASILDEEKVKEIRQMYASGISQSSICKKFNISRTSVSDIVCYRSWNEYAFPAEDIESGSLPVCNIRLLEGGDDETYEILDVPVNIRFKIGAFTYYFRQKVDTQFCLSKHDSEGFYLSDAHVLIVEPTHRNKWRNFIISSTRGNDFESFKMDRTEIYNVLYSVFHYYKNK